MTQLMVHGQKVDTVFELLGNNENAISYSLGWALAKCDTFRQAVAKLLGIQEGFSEALHIRLQEHQHEKGFTDIELIDPGKHHIIIEAKRGFTIPSPAQIEKYADRMHATPDPGARTLLVVLAESDRDETWLRLHVPDKVKDIPVKAISWRQFQAMAMQCVIHANHDEKRLLKQLIHYLGKVTNMQNQYSNLVYVVSLSRDTFSTADITFIDVVEKFGKYFHPVGGSKGGWPIEPPNYIAFRYSGALQSIHHIESYTVIENFYLHFPVPENSKTDEPLYLYTLGPTIKPQHYTPTNDPEGRYPQFFRNGRKWCFIDLLLTCSSVAEAAYKTRERQTIAEMMEEPQSSTDDVLA
jgi:hypothetical protein